jgi:ribonuclease P/MRP protein subunit POP5
MKDKAKTLPSSYREKKRYVTFEVLSDEKVSLEDLIKSVRKAVLNTIGILGMAKTNFHIFTELYDEKKNRFVLRCMPKDVENIRLSLALVTEINEKPACFRSLGVSGTIKTSKKKHLTQETLMGHRQKGL